MADFRSLLHHLHASNLLAWEDMPAGLAREVREALADDPNPSPAPTDSGAEPARGEGAFAGRRVCKTCAHKRSFGCGRLHPPDGRSEAVGQWLVDEYNRAFDPLGPLSPKYARNCPGWAPREAGEVSDG